MKIVRKTLALFATLALLLSAVACGVQNPDTTQKTEISFVDQAGRNVTLEEPAKRVVSCYYVTTYALLSLGLGDRLVGIEKKADTRPIYRMTKPELLDLPAVGSLKGIDSEKIASLQPDLVILPTALSDSAAVLEALGIATMIVHPENADDLLSMLTLIGKACGAEEKAAALIAYHEARLQDFTATDGTPRVLFLGNSSYLTAAPRGMYQNDLITLSGGINAFADTDGTYWTEISYETLLSLNPDYIVIPAGASYTAADLCADEALAGLSAVENGRVLCVPNAFEEWDSPIPSAVLGVLWLRSQLHSADYDAESLRKDTVTFYETFYGFTPDAEALDSLR